MKITVITVSYNSSATIVDTLRSVGTQSHQDVEHLVIDGRSTDGTVQIVEDHGRPNLVLSSGPDKGIYDAMNKGLALATGDVIGILNSDDFYLNTFVIADVVQAFADNVDVDMVLGNTDFVRPDDLIKPVRLYSSFYFAKWKMRFGFMPAHPAAFIKRSAYEKVGSYKLDYAIGADFEWFVRALLVHKLSYVKLNKTLVRMREGGVSTSGLKSYWISSLEQLRALRENGIYSNLAFTLIRLPIKFFQKYLVKVS